MSTYRDLIARALKDAHNPAHRQVAQATGCAIQGLAPSKPWGADMARELVYRENDIGALTSGQSDLDAEAPADLYRIVWNSCNTAIRLSNIK